MMPTSNDPVSHDQDCSHGRIRTCLAQAAARLDERSPHKPFVAISLPHAARLSLHGCQRNHRLPEIAQKSSAE
jgi:hypothetical protein